MFSLENNSSFDPIIFRAVERVVGGHLEGFDHKTVRNWSCPKSKKSRVNNIFFAGEQQKLKVKI